MQGGRGIESGFCLLRHVVLCDRQAGERKQLEQDRPARYTKLFLVRRLSTVHCQPTADPWTWAPPGFLLYNPLWPNRRGQAGPPTAVKT